jgi:hypothetical protein
VFESLDKVREIVETWLLEYPVRGPVFTGPDAKLVCAVLVLLPRGMMHSIPLMSTSTLSRDSAGRWVLVGMTRRQPSS